MTLPINRARPFRKQVRRVVDRGTIEMTISDKLRDRLQCYRLTDTVRDLFLQEGERGP